MFCSGCGQVLAQGQSFCPQCGRPAAPAPPISQFPPVPPVPGLEFQLADYAGKVKALAIVWFVYAGLSLLMGLAGLAFVKEFFSGGFGPWMQGPQPPTWILPMVMHFAWIFVVIRAGLAALTGWGLLQRTEWGRILAIIVAFLSLLRFPLGTALGIWTLLMLLGYRNSTLYQQL